MGTDIHFWTKDTIAGAVGSVVGDPINTLHREIITALGGNPGAGPTYNWPPHITGPVLNVKLDYGAKGDFTQDDYPAIQAAFDDQASSSGLTGTKAVYFPPGRYFCLKPPWIHAIAPVILAGHQGYNDAGRAPARIDVRGACGPAVYCQGSDATVIGLTTSLATGAGQAYHIADNNTWFNLRDCDGLDIHGLSQITIRCFLSTTDTTGASTRLICSSYGTWLPSDPVAQAFLFGRNASNHATGSLKLSGGTVNLIGTSTITDGATHVIEFNYDGSTVRLFVDGVQEASAAGSGTIVQEKSEDMCLGPNFSVTPERSAFTGALVCTIDSFEVADVARNVVNHSKPTAKFTADSHTRILLNNTATMGALVEVATANGVGWLHQRNNNFPNLNGTSGLMILGGLTITSNTHGLQGLLMAGTALDWTAENLQIIFCREGIRATNAGSYHALIQRPLFICETAARYGMAFGGLGGIIQINNGWIQGPQIAFASDAALTSIRETFFQTLPTTVLALLLSNMSGGSTNTFILDNIGVNTEIGVSSVYRAAIGVSGSHTQLLGRGGVIETGNDAPHIIMDSAGGGEWSGGDFRKLGSPPAVVHVQGSVPARPFEFRGTDQGLGFQNWCDTAGSATAHFPGRKGLAFSATPTFDFSSADVWTLGQLSANVTAQTWQNAGDGQSIVVRYQQNASAAKTVAAPSNVIGWTAVSATLGSISEFRGSYDQSLGKFVGSMFAGLT